MCGITGYISTQPININKAKSILPKMVDAINHRGPDEHGFHYDNNAALGMARLKIIDINNGSQPFYSKDKKVCVIFNGEIYNFKILRNQLQKDGFQFKSECDTEVIVYLYQKHGLNFVKYLNGMFSIAIWDSSIKQLILVRDRLGVKPLYYKIENHNTIYFASETFSLKASGINLIIDPKAIDLFLAYRSIPAPFSIYKDVIKLMPGELLIFNKDKCEIKKYWELEFKTDHSKNEFDFTEEFIERLKKAVSEQSFSDAPMGCLLSGGLDSSLITAFLTETRNTNFKTIFVKPGEGYYDESVYAKKIADLYKTDHVTIEIPDKFDLDYEKIINCFDEPFAHPTMFPTFYLSRESKKYVDTVLSGEGADEIFAGYGRYRTELIYKKIHSSPKLLIHLTNLLLKSSQKIISNKSVSHSSLRDNIDRAINKLSLLNENNKSRFVKHFQPFHYSERLKIIDRDYYDNPLDTDSIYINRMVSNGDYFNDRFNLDITTWLPDQMLTKADRMSMAHSLEMRVPFLDHEMVEFASSIPSEMKFSLNISKIIVRNAAKMHFPKSISKRPKHGLGVPIDHMYRTNLKENMLNIIEEGKSSVPFLSNRHINQLVYDHLNEKKNNGQKILSITSLISWLSNNH